MPGYAFLPLAYLIGSIPFGFLIAKFWKGIDIREHGSKNIGFTNVWRVIGLGPGLIVLVLDVAKGTVPVVLCPRFFPAEQGPLGMVAAGFLAILGHSCSLFLGFKGGRAVATSLGVVLGLHWPSALILLALWGALVALTRYISVGSMIASLTLSPLLVVFKQPVEFQFFAIPASLLILLRHLPNMKRLLAGTEFKVGQKVAVAEDGSPKTEEGSPKMEDGSPKAEERPTS